MKKEEFDFASCECQRCKGYTRVFTMSWFNEDMICPKCDKEELAHPLIDKAKEVEHKEVQKGNMNFEGIGLPEDLLKNPKEAN